MTDTAADRYTATHGGVRFISDVELLGIPDDHADLEVRVHWFTDDPPDGRRLTAPGGLTLWIVDGEVHLPKLHTEQGVKSWQVMQVAPIVAAAFGHIVLHASAVAVDDRIVAFVGESEAGKSLLAWELTKAGAVPAADDLLPLALGSEGIRVTTTDQPLALVAFVERGAAATRLLPMDAVDALQAHTRHGFGEHGDPHLWRDQFEAYSELVDRVPHLRLEVVEGRGEVTASMPALLDDLRTRLAD